MTPGEVSGETKVYELIGGELCLDFTNTVGGTRSDPKETLHSYGDLVRWGARAGAVAPDAAPRILAEAAERPGDAAEIHARALALREAIYRIFDGLARGAAPVLADLGVLNAELARALPHLRVESTGDGYDLRFPPDATALDAPLWPIAHSAAELLASGEVDRLKECSSDDCTWLFLDLSRNRSRRWCDMRDCGNRAKARRHYRRQKRASG